MPAPTVSHGTMGSSVTCSSATGGVTDNAGNRAVLRTVTSELTKAARSYCIPVRNVKTTLSPVPKPQNDGPQSPLLFPPKMQWNIHGALAQTRQTRPWMCRDVYVHVKPGKGQPQSLTHLMRLPQIPWNLRVAKMTHWSWLTPSDHRSIIQMMCIDCGTVSDDASLLRITKHP